MKTVFKNKFIIPIFFIVFCISIVFYQVIFLGKTLTTGIVSPGIMGSKKSINFNITQDKDVFNIIDPGASAWQDEPLTMKVKKIYKNLNLPLWNKNAGFGKPLAADMMSMSFSPLRIPLFINSSTNMFDVMLILRIITGGIFMYLFLTKLKISTLSSAVGSIIYTLSGYFIYNANIGHLYVELTIPLLLYSIERLIEKKSLFNFVLFTFSIILMIIEGHPESMIIACVLSTAYLLYRLVQKSEKRKEFIKKISLYILGISLAIGLLGFLIIPFLEFYLHSDVGIHNSSYKLYAARLPFNIFMFQFFPVLIQSALKSSNNNYWSSIILFLIVVGFFNKKFRGVYFFFCIASILLVTKVYSKYLFDWIRFIPIFNNFVYYTYLQPEISFSFAVMSAIGLEYFKNKNNIIKAFITGLLILISVYFYLYSNIAKINYSFGPKHLAGAIIIPLSLLLAYFLLRIVSNKVTIFKKWQIPFVFLCFITVFELIVFSPKDRPLRGDPYYKPNYVKFLERDKEPYRIFSTDQIMYPATSSVFNIDDIRDLHAVYPRLYISYIKNFIDDSIIDRFSEYGSSTKILNNKFFDMINTKYILSYRPLGVSENESLTKEIIKQNKLNSDSSLTWFNINHDSKPVLFEHPPRSITYQFIPTKEKSVLSFSIALDPKVWNPSFGKGVWFQINVINNDKQKIQVYKKFIDPKNNVDDRRWTENKIDLSIFENKEITLEFITVEKDTNAYDWAGWGNLKLTPSFTGNEKTVKNNNQFTEIYNDEILIYKNNKAFSRTFIVHNVIVKDNEKLAIKEMKSKNFDPRKAAVIISKNNQPIINGQDNNFDKEILEKPDHVSYISQEDKKLVFNTSTKNNGFLVISNIYYPGWKAYIDRQQADIFQTNLAFIGLFLPKGIHEVVLKYEPISYKIGFAVSSFSVLFFIFCIFKYRKKIKEKNNQNQE